MVRVRGLNDLLHFWQPPAPVTPQSQVFMQGLAGSGYIFPALRVVWTLSGLFLLTRRFIAIALVMLAEPVVAISGCPAMMEDLLLGPGLAVLLIYSVLAWQQCCGADAAVAAFATRNRGRLIDPSLRE